MTHVLDHLERKALEYLGFLYREYLIRGELPPNTGTRTLERLEGLGLVESGPSVRHRGETGWRITSDGWRCMYGRTHQEIMSLPKGAKARPLNVWQWPLAH